MSEFMQGWYGWWLCLAKAWSWEFVGFSTAIFVTVLVVIVVITVIALLIEHWRAVRRRG